jgi:hypothetical protein
MCCQSVLEQFETERVGHSLVPRIRRIAHAVFLHESRGWFGPVASPFGEHLVLTIEIRKGRAAALADVHDKVRSDWIEAKRDALALNTEKSPCRCHSALPGLAPVESRDQFETTNAQTPSKTVVLHRPEGKTNRHD